MHSPLYAIVQSLGEAIGRNVVFVWESYHEEWFGADDREYTTIRRGRGV